jgi:hypothetical protein
MQGDTRNFKTTSRYDEAEVRRRLGRVYYLLLHAGRETPTQEAQAAADQGIQADTERLV